MTNNPFNMPEWRALHHETSLASSLLCAGINSLGKATYTNLGTYYVALFSLANGMERLGKVVWSSDFKISNGNFPSDTELRSFGHRLPDIVHAVQEISSKHSLGLTYSYPASNITDAIIESLASFADASRGRYANLRALTSSAGVQDPVYHWWTTVGELILKAHYYGTTKETEDQAYAKWVEGTIGKHSLVLLTGEAGESIQSVADGSLREAQNAITQKYGRFHTASIIRWMSEVFQVLSCTAGAKEPTLFGHGEFVSTFTVPDRFLKSRKRWPLH